MGIGQFSGLTRAMEQRPEEAGCLVELHLSIMAPASGMNPLVSLLESRTCRRLKRLRLTFRNLCGSHVEPMASSLASGAGTRLLQELGLAGDLTAQALEVIAGALLAGACPCLRSFRWSTVKGVRDLPDPSSLAAILAGQAPCSASLKVFDLRRTVLATPGIRQIATALTEPIAVRLGVFGLACEGPGVENVLVLFDGPESRTETFLRKLDIFTRDDDERVDTAFTHALERGCWPCLQDVCIEGGGRSRTTSHSLKALRRRREEERWGGDWSRGNDGLDDTTPLRGETWSGDKGWLRGW